MKLDDELPFPLSDVSNGEWCPRPPSARQVAAYHLLIAEADRLACSRGQGVAQEDRGHGPGSQALKGVYSTL